jgi:hypothetical protein
MALVINNRVRETTSTTGTGAVTLGGAVGGFQTFAAGIGNDNTTYYAISINTESEWEVGLGTLNSDSSTLTRTTVLESSNSDSAVDFAAGSKEVFCTLPSEKAIYLDASDNQVGGFSSLADDGSPQLGANLDLVTYDIVTTSNRDIDIIPHGTGDVNLGADTVQVGDNDANATLTTQGTGDLILNTNNGTNAGDITLLDGANGNINLAPNGTGEIVLGSGSADGDITSNGAYDLIVDTNGGTNAGNLTLTNGANGAITLTPNGTETFDLYIDPAAGSNDTYIYKLQALAASATFEHTTRIVMNATDVLYGRTAGSADVDVVISYLDQTL